MGSIRADGNGKRIKKHSNKRAFQGVPLADPGCGSLARTCYYSICMNERQELLRSPQSPRRGEWALLSRILPREVSPGEGLGPTAAAAQLKKLLKEAWEASPTAVIYQVAGIEQAQRESVKEKGKELAGYKSLLRTELELGSAGKCFKGEKRGIYEWDPLTDFLQPYLCQGIETVNAYWQKNGLGAKRAKKPLPAANSPDRPEWDMLGKLTRSGNLFKPGLAEGEAAARMKHYLEKAWAQRPREVLWCMAKGMLSPRQREYETGGRRGKFQEYMRFLVDRMWCDADDGNLTAGADPTRGHSGRHIGYWDPKSGGLKAYISACVGYINVEWEKEQKRLGAQESIDVRREIGMEPVQDADGAVRFVRHERFSESSEEDSGQHGEAHEGSQPDEERTPEGLAQRSANTRAAVLTLIRDRAAEEGVLDSEFRGEYEFFGRVLGEEIAPADDSESRAAQLKDVARRVLETACREMDLEDRESFADALDGPDKESAWDPAKRSFFVFFPDVTDFLIEKAGAPELNGKMSLGRDLARTLLAPSPTEPGAGLSQPDIFAEMRTSRKAIRTTEMWSQKGTPSVLLSPSRPDYAFLAEALNERTRDDLTEGDPVSGTYDRRLEAELRRMAVEFIGSKLVDGVRPIEIDARLKPIVKEMTGKRLAGPSGADQTNARLLAAAANWKPMTDGLFGEMLLDTLGTISREIQLKVEEKEAELASSFRPDPNVAADLVGNAERVRQKRVVAATLEAMEGQSSLFDEMFGGRGPSDAVPEPAPQEPAVAAVATEKPCASTEIAPPPLEPASIKDRVAALEERLGVAPEALRELPLEDLFKKQPEEPGIQGEPNL